MTQAPAPTDPRSQAPLLQQLAALDLLGSRIPSSPGLAQLLGDEIDLADSITLASALTSLDRARPMGNASMEAPQRQFLNARAGMLRLIANCFEPGEAPAPYPLPQPTTETLSDPAEGFKPLQRFYSLLQSELDHRASTLRRSLRAAMGYEGPALIKLAALDRIIDDTLGDYSRRVLATVPKLLGEHFRRQREIFLQSDDAAQQTRPADWMQADGWMHDFYRDMQTLLLTELDFRLLPARALLDSLQDALPTDREQQEHS